MIENNAIIGTCAVVAGSHIPTGTIVAGNPAKIIKDNINWDINRI